MEREKNIKKSKYIFKINNHQFFFVDQAQQMSPESEDFFLYFIFSFYENQALLKLIFISKINLLLKMI